MHHPYSFNKVMNKRAQEEINRQNTMNEWQETIQHDNPVNQSSNLAYPKEVAKHLIKQGELTGKINK